jgi:hypothetical protein
MKTLMAVEIYLHAFLVSTVVGGKWSASRHGRLIPSENAPGIHWTGGSVASRGRFDAVEIRKMFCFHPVPLHFRW